MEISALRTRDRLLLWAVVAGIVGSLVGLAFRWSAMEMLHLWTGESGPARAFAQMTWWERLLLPALGGWLAGWVLRMASKGPIKGGDYLEAVVVGDGRIPVRETLWKSASAFVTIATGGSIGKEGPMVQLAALCASMLGAWRRMTPENMRLLTACGGAAGIACAYNAPIAGAFFVAEIALGSLRAIQMAPLVVAAVFSTATVREINGEGPLYFVTQPVFGSFRELALFLLLGILCGLLTPIYLGGLRIVREKFQRIPLALPQRMLLGGLVVGIAAIWIPEVAGNGHFAILDILHGNRVWQFVAMLVVVKWIATACCFGSGAVGGVFTPTLFTGTGLGFVFGAICTEAGLLPPGGEFAGAVVGMAALLAGATRAPIMAMLMAMELTQDQSALLPIMLACVAASVIADRSSESPLYPAILIRGEPEQNPART